MDDQDDEVCLRLTSISFVDGDNITIDNNDNTDSNSPDNVVSAPATSRRSKAVTKDELEETLRLIAVTFQQMKLSIDSVNDRLKKIEDLAGVGNNDGKMVEN
jgi:hypothetical protein